MDELLCDTCRKDLHKEKIFFEDQMPPVKIFCTFCAVIRLDFDSKLVDDLLLDEKLFINKYKNQNIIGAVSEDRKCTNNNTRYHVLFPK